MRNVKFLKEPGFVFDLFFLFVLHFNKDYCLKNFINYGKASEDTAFFKNILNDFPQISDELLVFFYLRDDNLCFMSQKYHKPYKDQFLSDTYNLSVVLDALTDHDQVVENLLEFYFRDVDKQTLDACKGSMHAINKLIKDSSYSAEVKSALYAFFIDPSPIIRRLSYELMEKEFALTKRYDNYSKRILDLKENFDFGQLCDGLKNGQQQKGDLSCFENIYVSFCTLNKNYIKSLFCENAAIAILGFDYIEQIDYLLMQNKTPELDVFGNAVSETNRINVLNLILESGEVTIKDLEQEFGFTGTNAYYHLSLMIKAGMLKTRNRGRTVLYSINKDYFQVLCDILGKYYKS